MIKKLYKNGKERALTFSFDDGCAQDIRTVLCLNRYGLHGTFNFNGYHCRIYGFCLDESNQEKCLWEGSDAFREFFKEQEIASHTLTHPDLATLSYDKQLWEISEDVRLLSDAAGYKIIGFAAPFNKFTEEAYKILPSCGILYGRARGRNMDFSLPEDFLKWVPAPHFSYYFKPEGKQLIKDFFATDKELACMMIWGHSFELNRSDCYSKNDWIGCEHRLNYFENELCPCVAGKSDTWYATCGDICKYALEMRKAVITDSYIENPSDEVLWFKIDGNTVELNPKERLNLKK